MQTAALIATKEIDLRSGSPRDDLLSLSMKDRVQGGYLDEEMPEMLNLLPPPPDTGTFAFFLNDQFTLPEFPPHLKEPAWVLTTFS